MSGNPIPDPFEFMKKLWSPIGAAAPGFNPGMVFPTTNLEEIDKRLADLRSVEGWLALNIEVVRATIQGLEAQKATLAAFQSMQAQAAATFNAAQEAGRQFVPPGDAVDAQRSRRSAKKKAP